MTAKPELFGLLGLTIVTVVVSGIAPVYAANLYDVPIGMGIELTRMQELPILDHYEYDYAYRLTFENTGEFTLIIAFDYIGYYSYSPVIHPSFPFTQNTFCDSRLEIPPGGAGTMDICYTFEKGDDHVPGFKAHVHDHRVHRGVSDVIEFGANNPLGKYSSTCNRYFGEFCLSVGEAIESLPGLVPSLRATIMDGFGGFTELDGAAGVDIVEISGRVYAVVTAWTGDGIQIIDITDPVRPTPTAAITDEADGFTKLDGAAGVDIVEISGRVYAVVAARDDDGVQIIDITDPTTPVPTVAVADGRSGFIVLDGAFGVDIVEISGRVYAIITAQHGDGVQMIDITDPTLPIPTAAAVDDWDGFTKLDGATGVDTVEISGRVYAVVAARDDDGVQIIDITDPATMAPVVTIADGAYAFTELDGATDVEIAEISGRVYAVVAARVDDGVQIIDITNPSNPTPTAAITDGADGFTKLNGAVGVEIVDISGHVYAIITAEDDHGVQMIDITNPATPVPVTSFHSWYNTSTDSRGTFGVATAKILERIHMVVTAWLDDSVRIIDIQSPLNRLTPPVNTLLSTANHHLTPHTDNSTNSHLTPHTDNSTNSHLTPHTDNSTNSHLTPHTDNSTNSHLTPHTDYPPNHPAINFFAISAGYDRVSGTLSITFTQDVGEVDLWYVRMSGDGASSTLDGADVTYKGNTVSIALTDQDIENFKSVDVVRLVFNEYAVTRSDTMFMLPQTLIIDIIR